MRGHALPKAAVSLGILAMYCFTRSPVTAAAEYILTDLGTTVGSTVYDQSTARGINNAGQVVGSVGGPTRAFLWDAQSGMANLGTLCPPPCGEFHQNTQAVAISESGQVVGISHIASVPQSFSWTPGGGMVGLGQGTFYANDVNISGQIAGCSGVALENTQAYFLDPEDGLLDLNAILGSANSTATGINDSGQVVGYFTTLDGAKRSFLWDAADGMRDIGDLGGGVCWAAAINNPGQIVGRSYPSGGGSFAFLWDPATQSMINLGTLGARYGSAAMALNSRGQVVGSSTDALGRDHAFYWDATTGMFDLNSVVPQDSGWELWQALGINDSGQIVGQGRLNGVIRAFLLTPIPGNAVPEANAGPDLTLHWADQGTAVVSGQAFDTDDDALTYRWTDTTGGAALVLQDWGAVGPAGEAAMDLGSLQPLALGLHLLTLEVADGQATAADSVLFNVVNSPPVCVVEDNLQITTAQQVGTTISATVIDADEDPLLYSWTITRSGSSEPVLQTPWYETALPSVSLCLGDVAALATGEYDITIEAFDGLEYATGTTELVVENSPPVVVASGAGTYQVGIDTIVLGGTVSDFDGDLLSYEWAEIEPAPSPVGGGVVQSLAGGEPVDLPDLGVALAVGVHRLLLTVSDGVSASPGVQEIVVEVIDTVAPTLMPSVTPRVLWPPNHELVPVVVVANAFDNGGGVPMLAVSVMSSEPADSAADGSTEPDIVVQGVDQQTGVISLLLRSERAGTGGGRTYTITVVATDAPGNQSSAQLGVAAPHDMRKK